MFGLLGDHLGVAFEHVCVEEAVFHSAIGESHNASAMLDAFDPISFVARPVSPIHLSIAHSFVIYVVSMVNVAALPSESSHAVLLVVLVLTFKSVTFRVVCNFSPLALAMLHAVLEFTCVYTSIFPLVDSLALRLAHVVLPRINIPIRKYIRSFPVLEAVIPRTFVLIAVLPLMDSVAVGFAHVPLAHVTVSEDSFPHAISVLDAFGPFTVVYFAVSPVVHSFAMSFALLEVSFIFVAVGVTLVALACALVAYPLPLVDSVFAIDHDAEPLSLVVFC